MGSKGSMPAMPAPVMMPTPREADYLPPKTDLPEPEVVTQAKLDDEKRRKMQRLASTDTRENTIMNEGGALGLGEVTEEEVDKPSLFYKKKVVGTKSNTGLLSS